MWKKTFKTIDQLSCFVAHPVLKGTVIVISSDPPFKKKRGACPMSLKSLSDNFSLLKSVYF